MSQEAFDRLATLLQQLTGPVDSQPGIDGSGRIVDENGTVRIVRRSFVNAQFLGPTLALAAQGPGVKIRVLGVATAAASSVTVRWLSGAAAISAGMPVTAGVPFVLPETKHGWFETLPNEALNLQVE